MAEITRTRITADEFFKLPETMRKTELFDGEVIIEMPPIDDHQEIVGLLHLLLSRLIPGGILRLAPLSVNLDEYNVPEPDMFWVSGPESRCKLGKDRQWYGAPDLVVEVHSPSTMRYDKREKFQLYEQHGVREYWMVHPEAQYVEVWELINQKFQLKGVFAPEQTFDSIVLGGQTIELKMIFVESKNEE